MSYFITGGTGFLGRNFIDKLKNRSGDIYVLIRAESMHKFEELQTRMGDQSERLIPVQGNLLKPLLGREQSDAEKDEGENKVLLPFRSYLRHWRFGGGANRY